jgi:SAM-dependent methyltransferase
MTSPASGFSNTISLEMRELTTHACPSCQSQRMLVFYEIDTVPVHSCLLISNRDQALMYPTGQLRLGLCEQCGFISNTSFDPSVHHYSAQYEETQGFSGRFRAFSHDLCSRLIEQYGIRNKRIIEIGCGKGEFLAEMCALGNNTGIGIDPAYVPERNPAEGASSVSFIQDFYSEKYAHLEADVICCRHTLEHIDDTFVFLKTIRDAIGDRTQTLMIFEVPETLRVLREGAFWDIYYEHCSYFTPASLARLFDATGFDTDQLDLVFDDQYIVITAYPRVQDRGPGASREVDIASLRQAVDDFRQACRAGLTYWKGVIDRASEDDKKIVAWGSGSKAVAFLTTLGLGDTIEYVVDINPYRQGKFLPCTGQEIVSPEFLQQYRPDQIIVMNPIYGDEIQQDLTRLGLTAELLPVTSFVQA